MLEGEVMNDDHLPACGPQRTEAIRGEKHIRLNFSKGSRDGSFKPPIPQKRMPRLGMQDHGNDVGGKNEFLVIFTIEEEIKLMFRMLRGYALQRFIGKPAYTFQPVLN